MCFYYVIHIIVLGAQCKPERASTTIEWTRESERDYARVQTRVRQTTFCRLQSYSYTWNTLLPLNCGVAAACLLIHALIGHDIYVVGFKFRLRPSSPDLYMHDLMEYIWMWMLFIFQYNISFAWLFSSSVFFNFFWFLNFFLFSCV